MAIAGDYRPIYTHDMQNLLATCRQKVRRVDWRAWVIVGVTAAVLLATAFVYWEGWGLNPATHFGAVFASWVSGVALFAVAGSLIAFVSLARPERESFDSRARILFRRQTGRHIDYIVGRIGKTLEHYAESTMLKVTIRSFNASERKFRVSATSEIVVRSYIDDVETTYTSNLVREEVTPCPAGGEPNRLVFARVAGEPVGSSEEFASTVSRPISCRIEPDCSCDVESLMEFWIRADDEPNTHVPSRYTQSLTLLFENWVPAEHQVAIKVSVDGGTTWIDEQLPHGKSKKILELKDLAPGKEVFDYRILAI